MSTEAIGLLGFLAVVVMILVRIPIGIAMALCGLVGTWIIGGFDM